MTPCFPFSHVPANDLRRDDGAHQVQVEHPAQGILRKVKEGLIGSGGGIRLVAASAVDQAVNFVEFGKDKVHRCQNCLGLQYICLYSQGLTTTGNLVELIHHFLGSCQVVIQNSNIGSAGKDCPGHLPAQHASPAGDDNALTAEIVRFTEILAHPGTLFF